MTGATLILVLAGVIIAFWAGGRWRRNAKTWADHRTAKAARNTLKKTRWVTFRAVTIALFVLVVYLFATGAISLHLGSNHDAVPAQVGNPTTPSPTAHRSPSPHKSAEPHKTP
jgi:ABC-type Fe3+ transport system permease subunit